MTIEWSSTAKKQLLRLDIESFKRVSAAVKSYANDQRGNIKTLSGKLKGYLRLRIGDYRVIFYIENDVIKIVELGHRRDIYK